MRVMGGKNRCGGRVFWIRPGSRARLAVANPNPSASPISLIHTAWICTDLSIPIGNDTALLGVRGKISTYPEVVSSSGVTRVVQGVWSTPGDMQRGWHVLEG